MTISLPHPRCLVSVRPTSDLRGIAENTSLGEISPRLVLGGSLEPVPEEWERPTAKVRVVSFSEELDIETSNEILGEEGYRHATAHELLGFWTDHPCLMYDQPICAVGSAVRIPGKPPLFLAITWEGKKRRLVFAPLSTVASAKTGMAYLIAQLPRS